jgi:leucyl aminopeptidase
VNLKSLVGDISQMDCDAVIVNLFEGVQKLSGVTGSLDTSLGGIIEDLINDGEINGKEGSMTLLHTFGRISPKRVLVLGLGEAEQFDLNVVRKVTADSCRYLRGKGIKRIGSIVHEVGVGGLQVSQSAQAMTEGVLLGLYSFNQYKGKQNRTDEKAIDEFFLVEKDSEKIGDIDEGIAVGRVLSDATILARELVNQPSNFMTPTLLAKSAETMAFENGLDVTILDRDQCEELQMGAFLGIAQGSEEPPKFIVLRYKGDSENPDNNLGLIGKGITFDTGGISLKSASGMGEMKSDMAGGASVIAAMQAIARLKPRINVMGIVAATENMPSGTAIKPADILYAMNGTTIEIDNTDAEGRVTLADAVCYARQEGIQRVIDVATLTGAIITALGKVRIGVFGNHQPLIDSVLEAGDASGEKMWQLPMDKEYKEQNKSNVADIKNTGGPGAGSITAAHFIGEFAKDLLWVHLDIAGMAMTDRERGLHVKGATGIPVRSLVKLALNLASHPSP